VDNLVIIRGGGDLASGIAIRLHRVGIKLIICELSEPLTVRRSVSFSEAVYQGEVKVEDVSAVLVSNLSEAIEIIDLGKIPVIIDPELSVLRELKPLVLIDGRMRKKPPEEKIDSDAMLIGIGPGFNAGKDCDAVVESKRGHTLGRVIWQGSAIADTGIAGEVLGFAKERVLHAPQAGILRPQKTIGDFVEKDEIIAYVDGFPVLSSFDGMIRGMAHDGIRVHKGMKIGDVDPRRDPNLCQLVSEKALAIAGGVLEAMLSNSIVLTSLWHE